jgi:hypothetical protein
MLELKTKINTVEGVSGSDITITQVYAPGNAGIETEAFIRKGNAQPFSLDWLMFAEEAVPFFGRTGELDAIKAFLDDPRPFSWWCVVGPGGSGKSRLALQAVRQMPDGWSAGFLPKDRISVHHAAAWRPTGNTFWVIDYAADHTSQLRQFLALLSRLLGNSPHRLRILLLERGFSDETGWWDELNHSIVRERGAVDTSLFRAPLTLAPLGESARDFLRHVAEILPEPEKSDLTGALVYEAFAASALAMLSEQGNPLLLLLLAAEVVRRRGQIPKRFHISSPDIVGRYLDRELDMLRDRVHRFRLRFTQAADILFVTTSVYPLNYVRDMDKLIIATPDDEAVIVEEVKSGKQRVPSVSELGEVGREIADKHNRTVVHNLSQAADVDDAEPYLTALEDAGFSKLHRWSLQPDLLGEAFIRLMVNSPVLTAAQKQKRPEYRRARVARVIEGAVGLSMMNATRNWARLDTSTLLALTGHLRDQGKSVRLLLVTLKVLNLLRNEKLPFNAYDAFSMSNPRSRSAAIGRYYKTVWPALDDDSDNDTSERVTKSDHAWLLPYFEYLHVLSPRQKFNLAQLICRVRVPATLSRLTNLANAVHVLRMYATQIASNDNPAGWHGAGLDLGSLIDQIITYIADVAMPVLLASEESDLDEPFDHAANALIVASYAILNQSLDREEGAAGWDHALRALTLARAALAIAPDTDALAYVDRNEAALTMRMNAGSPEAITFNTQTLARLETYAGPVHCSRATVELLHYACQRQSLPALMRGFEYLLNAAAKGLVLLAIVAPAVPAMLDELTKPDVDRCDAVAMMLTICESLCTVLVSADDSDAFAAFGYALAITIPFALAEKGNRLAIRHFFERSRAILDSEQCGSDFVHTILQAAALAAYLWRKVDSSAEPLPFDVTLDEPTDEERARAWEEGFAIGSAASPPGRVSTRIATSNA